MKLAYNVSAREHWISAAGALIAMAAIVSVSLWLEGPHAVFTIASMGASVVLVFAAPHGAMSQPWPVIGGHLTSAAIGVACALVFGNQLVLAAALAVALALAAMYAMRCLHPPGGATALYAVLGGDAVHALGFGYLLNPVLLNIAVLLLVAIAFNLPLKWRRYPQAWAVQRSADSHEEPMIPHTHLVYALSQLDTFIDVSEEDLLRIYALAVHGRQPVGQPQKQMGDVQLPWAPRPATAEEETAPKP